MREPLVSVVVPVKNSAGTIRLCVESILSQDYPAFEILVVGDCEDSSWPELEHISDERLTCVRVQVSMNGATRDANLKRSIGLAEANGAVIAMTDSDMSFGPGWLADGVALTDLFDVVASSMISTATGFLGHYVDNNRLGSRTPRYDEGYVLTAENFGRRGFKPPVTANLFMRREVYEVTKGPNPAFTRSYEDYEWARRIVDAGFSILSTDRLAGYHAHRVRVREILRDYRRSGRGCADYIVTHPRCELAKSRARQAAVIAAAVPAGIAALFVGGSVVLLGPAVAAAVVMALSWQRSRSAVALAYPWITLLLGMTFWVGLSGQLIQNRPRITFRGVVLPKPVGVVVLPAGTEGGTPASLDSTDADVSSAGQHDLRPADGLASGGRLA